MGAYLSDDGYYRDVDWVSVVVVDDAETANTDVMFLRSSDIQGRSRELESGFSVEVRPDDVATAQSVLQAREQLRTGRLETHRRPRREFLARTGVRLLIGVVLLVVAFPALALLIGSSRSGFGAAGVALLLIIVVAVPAATYVKRKMPSNLGDGEPMVASADHEARNLDGWMGGSTTDQRRHDH